MKKLENLRQHLLDSPLGLVADNLLTFADKGQVISRPGDTGDDDFEFRYNAHIIITEYSGPADKFAFVLVAWLNANEQHRGEKAFSFDADILKHDLVDISAVVPLTETVKVTRKPEGITLTHCDDPQVSDTLLPAATWQAFINDEVDPISEWVNAG